MHTPNRQLLFTLITLICLPALITCVHPPGLGLFGGDQREVEKWPGDDGAEEKTWYYRELDGTVCANGTTSGIGVNRGTDEDLVIYLSGGGACWDETSCSYFQFAANMDVTYGVEALGEELDPLMNSGLFDRDAEVNPWKTASYVYVPYCTADLHIGRNIAVYDGFRGGDVVRHEGARNLERILQEVPSMFPDVQRVWLVGISAGGYGVSWNFHRFYDAFDDVEIHVFTDASPWLAVDDDQWQEWKDRWNPVMPPGCMGCDIQPDILPQFLARQYPESRFALSVFARDPVLSAYQRTTPGRLESEIDEFVEQRITEPNSRVFVADGWHHESLLRLDEDVRSRDGDRLVDFLNEWVEGW